MQRLFAAGKDVRALGYAKVAAIGQTTAKKLQSYGIRADVVPQEFRAEGILESLKGKLPPHAKILLPRAAVAREILPEKLREQGAEVDVVPVYQTVMAETSEEERAALREELENGAIDFVTFTSSSTVVNLVKLLGGIEPLKGIKTACIGPVRPRRPASTASSPLSWPRTTPSRASSKRCARASPERRIHFILFSYCHGRYLSDIYVFRRCCYV